MAKTHRFPEEPPLAAHSNDPDRTGDESVRRELELLAAHMASCDRSRGQWSEPRRLLQTAGGVMAGRVVTTAISVAGVVLTVLMAWPGAARM